MGSESLPAELLEARKKIDRIDGDLLVLLAERFALTHRVGILKASNGLEAVDEVREAQKLAELCTQSEKHGLNPEFITELFSHIMKEVVKNHRQLRG